MPQQGAPRRHRPTRGLEHLTKFETANTAQHMWKAFLLFLILFEDQHPRQAYQQYTNFKRELAVRSIFAMKINDNCITPTYRTYL